MNTQHTQPHALGPLFAPTWHRPFLRYLDGEQGGGAPGATEGTEGEGQQSQGLSQADVDRIVKERLAQQAKKYSDYEELKAKAEGAKSVEQKLADLEQKHAAAEARALRSDIAAKHGISAEDRDLFLTGSDESALEAQAKRLAERDADRKKNGNVARKEGGTTTNDDGSKDLRAFTRNLFAAAQTE